MKVYIKKDLNIYLDSEQGRIYKSFKGNTCYDIDKRSGEYLVSKGYAESKAFAPLQNKAIVSAPQNKGEEQEEEAEVSEMESEREKELENLSLDELREICKEKGIKYSNVSRENKLINKILENE
jgi:hypothetical protein